MLRLAVLIVAIYGAGHPALDRHRPEPLDRPLRNLHRDMNRTIDDSRRAVRLLDDARSMRYLEGLSGAFAAMLRNR